MSERWQDMISEPAAENLPAPADEVLYPALVKLSLRRRLEILEAIEIPAVIEARHIPLVKVVREIAADVTRDAIKIGEAQVRRQESHIEAIKAAIEAYRANTQTIENVPE